MALQLKRQIEERIERQIAAGHYGSANDLVTEALDLLESHKKSVASELHRRHAETMSAEVTPMDPEEARSRSKEHH
jgi:Arc/MetJ-type ribon-helix-helix transcriptional regulator